MSWIAHFWNLKWKSKINLDFYHFSIKVPKVAVEFWFNLLALTNFGMPVELWLWNICSKALTFFFLTFPAIPAKCMEIYVTNWLHAANWKTSKYFKTSWSASINSQVCKRIHHVQYGLYKKKGFFWKIYEVNNFVKALWSSQIRKVENFILNLR